MANDRKLSTAPPSVSPNEDLHLAAMVNDVPWIHRLVAAKADINAENEDGDTPLHLAARHNQNDACRAIIDIGCRMFAINKKGERARDLLNEEMKSYWRKKNEDSAQAYTKSKEQKERSKFTYNKPNFFNLERRVPREILRIRAVSD